MTVSEDKFFVGYTENRGWKIGSLQIDLNRKLKEAMVSEFGIARPGGNFFKLVSFYNSKGHYISEIVVG